MYDPKSIAEKIKKVAKERKISLKSVLENCGLSKNTLSSMQSGGSIPKSENLAKIADYLDVTVDYLLGRTDDPNPPKPRLPDELQALLDKQEHEHVLYTLSAGGRNQQMVILSDEEYDWLQATLKTYREQKEKSENQEK